MADAARRVTDHLRVGLAERIGSHRWQAEWGLGETRVDLAGVGDPHVLVELEWRRADPVNNTVSLFRALGTDDSTDERAVVCQVFTRYYDLASGGTSTRRRNAEFVGRLADEQLPMVTYRPITLDLTPPKRDGALPDEWRSAVEAITDEIVAVVDSGDS